MSTDQQRSFTARLTIDHHQLNFLNILHGKPVIINDTVFSGGFFTGAVQSRDHSNLLSFRPDCHEKVAPLNIYFRCSDDYYVMYVHSPAVYRWNCIDTNPKRILGAFPAAGSQTASFNLFDRNGRVVTLDDLYGPVHTLWLKARNAGKLGGMKVRGSPHIYLADAGDDGLPFKLNILKRNVPF
ncbi:hypothetical protein [Pseudomonas putida]|uniref:hypothetical protein n=1 Tax=Pseudomonas putida TaxID=303 RepID=UPI003D96C083